jgi:hypothetical protein
MDISKSCRQISNWLNTSVTITVTQHIPAASPMMKETPIGNHSDCSGTIVSGKVMIFMWFRISYLRGWVANWYVNVRCCKIMKSAGIWNWSAYLGWILADREGGDWSWFSLLFDLLY